MPMKRVPFIGILGLSVVIFLGSTLNCIYAMTSVGVWNHFETGIVDIRITEHQMTEGGEMQWQDNPTVLPGDVISKIPRIHNDGNDCYIRANIKVYEKEEDIEKEKLSAIEMQGISEQWILAQDGYYYYKNILSTGETVDLFRTVLIADHLSESMMGKTFYIDVNVDAIQAQNFIPQFDCVEPWGSIEILECEKEGMYDIRSFKQSSTQSFQIVYQGDSEKLIANSKDFFANFSYFMPGDRKCDTIDIINRSEEEIPFYFRSEVLDDSELLDEMILKITTEMNGKREKVYEGSLRATKLADDILLGKIAKHEIGKFYFEIKVPETLNNPYSITKSFVKWIFSTEPITNSPLKPGQAGQTGDGNGIKLSVSILGILISMLMSVFAMTKLKESEEL